MSTRKGDRYVSEYLMQIKALVDGLVFIGCPVFENEHITTMFEGLIIEYDPFINTQLEPYTVSEMEALLLAQHVRFEKHTKNESADKILVNVATNEEKEKSANSEGKLNQSSGSAHGTNQNRSGGGKSFNRSRGRGNRGGGKYVICQLCNHPGHNVINCFHHFD